MRKVVTIIFLFLLPALLLCTNGEASREDSDAGAREFPREEAIKVKHYAFDGLIYDVGEMRMQDSLIFIIDQDDPEQSLFVLARRKGRVKIISDGLPKGKGPSEISTPFDLAVWGDSLYIAEHNRQRIVYNSIEKLAFSSYPDLKILPLGKGPKYLDAEDDFGLLVGVPATKDYRFLKINGKNIQGISPVPKAYSDVSIVKAFNWELGRIRIKPGGNKFVRLMFYADRLQFFSSNGDFLKEVVGPIGKKRDDMGFTGYHAFYDMIATENYILGLFYGKKYDENNPYAKQILVYDWDGNPVKKFILDQGIEKICYDSQKQEVIGVTPGETIDFVHFGLPGLTGF